MKAVNGIINALRMEMVKKTNIAIVGGNNRKGKKYVDHMFKNIWKMKMKI